MSEPLEPYEPIVARGPGLWTVDGDWGSSSFRRRMTLLGAGDDLIVHSAIRMRDEDLAKLDRLGRVAGIVVPNAFHASEAPFYAERYPRARVLVPAAQVEHQRTRMRVDGTIDRDWPAWFTGVEALALAGTRSDETVLLHRPSRTLVTCDLVFHMKSAAFRSGLERTLMRWNRVGDRFGPSWFFDTLVTSDAAALGQSLERVLAWDFDRVVMSHGDVLETGGKVALTAAFAHRLTLG